MHHIRMKQYENNGEAAREREVELEEYEMKLILSYRETLPGHSEVMSIRPRNEIINEKGEDK